MAFFACVGMTPFFFFFWDSTTESTNGLKGRFFSLLGTAEKYWEIAFAPAAVGFFTLDTMLEAAFVALPAVTKTSNMHVRYNFQTTLRNMHKWYWLLKSNCLCCN